ncbi:MAG: carboxypeptidase-like regulatory domain-containing protein, partial [Clostridia bacterium]|nr:carboxypeptidase-like regulatory domain-containing protein [Clostridia bacterium]
MKKCILILMAVALTLSVKTGFAQPGGQHRGGGPRQEVTGTVTDASTGEPIPFAAVRVDGTMIGASSGVDGAYVIPVPSREESVLVFSFMGYKTLSVPVKSRGVIDVALEPDALALQETIVVAFGTATRESFTGSAAVVDSDN